MWNEIKHVKICNSKSTGGNHGIVRGETRTPAWEQPKGRNYTSKNELKVCRHESTKVLSLYICEFGGGGGRKHKIKTLQEGRVAKTKGR